MYGLKKLLTMEEERLQNLKHIIDPRLDVAPEGNLRITSSGTTVQYMQCTDESDKSKTQGTYIKKENKNLIMSLAQKSYDQKIKRLVDKRLKQIQSLNKDYNDEEIYWEHEGRMDDAEYVEKAIRKIDQYTKNNIIPGKRLILTYESSTYALNTSIAEMLIREHLL